MKINITLDTTGAALIDNQVESYLVCHRAITEIFSGGKTCGTLLDSNGNKVGNFEAFE